MKKVVVFLILTMLFVARAYSVEKLNLRDSIEIAKANSESIAIARWKVEAAEGLAGQAFSAFLPTLKIDASLAKNYSEQPPINVEGIPPIKPEPSEAENFAYSGTITQNLFAGGRIWNSYVAADLGVAAAREEYRGNEIDLTYNVISAYYSVVKANKALELSEDSLEMAAKHLEQTKVMFSSGVVTKADILRSELEVAKAELAETKAKSAVDFANNSFNVIVGRPLDVQVILNEDDFKMGDLTAPDYNEFLSIAYKERPEWKIVKLGKDIASSQSYASYSGYLPSLLLSGSYGYNDYRNQKFDVDENLKNWNVALIGSWTIFDGLSTPNRIKEAYAKYAWAAKNKDLLQKNIAIDVKNACSALNSAVNEVRSAQKALELADENYKIAELRYSSGVGTNVEVMDAKTMYTSAKLDLLQAEFDYELAKAAVNKAVGKEVFIEKQQQKELGEPEIVLHGTAAYVPLEGGFVGFLDQEGNRYDLAGIKVAEINSIIGTTEAGKKVKIIGKVKKGIVTIHMWGTPFEVTGYEWE